MLLCSASSAFLNSEKPWRREFWFWIFNYTALFHVLLLHCRCAQTRNDVLSHQLTGALSHLYAMMEKGQPDIHLMMFLTVRYIEWSLWGSSSTLLVFVGMLTVPFLSSIFLAVSCYRHCTKLCPTLQRRMNEQECTVNKMRMSAGQLLQTISLKLYPHCRWVLFCEWMKLNLRYMICTCNW